MPFVCSICEEESTRICVRCTKDTCSNHLCEKCGACSDCCDCELHLDEEPPELAAFNSPAAAAARKPEPDGISVANELVAPSADEAAEHPPEEEAGRSDAEPAVS